MPVNKTWACIKRVSKRLTNELSRTAKPCPLERRVRYAGQAPAPHSSALCARLCRVPSLPGVALGRQAIASRMVFGSRAKRLADDIYKKNETPGRAGEYFLYISIRLIDLSQQENDVVLTTI